jgi:arylsulfatase
MDMFPTFCEIAGISLSGEMKIDGSSIVSILERNSALPERSVCWKNGDRRAIRRGAWKLCLAGNNRPELYNLDEDPGESRDLSSRNSEVVGRMIAEYRAWEEEVTKDY